MYVWTPEKDAFLRAKYDSLVRGRAAQIGALWGWPHWVIKKRAQGLGIARPTWNDTRRSWTAEEDAALEQYAGKRYPLWIARHLHRSLTSIVVRMKRLRLSRCPEGLNQTAVAEAFGCSRDTVERWLLKGWLGASRAPAGNGERYGITETDLLAFIRAYPTAFELRNVDQTWFLDLVLGAPPAPVAVPVWPTRATRQQAVLEAYRHIGSMRSACKAVGVSPSVFYHWRRTDPAFCRRLEDVRTSRAA